MGSEPWEIGLIILVVIILFGGKKLWRELRKLLPK